MTKKLFILSAIALVLAAGVIMLKSSGQSAGWLWDISQSGAWFLPLVIVAALIDSINPCAFSILILTIAFLVSLGRLRPGILKIGLMYILGIFVIYLMIGRSVDNYFRSIFAKNFINRFIITNFEIFMGQREQFK